MKKLVITVCLLCIIIVGCTNRQSSQNDISDSTVKIIYNINDVDFGIEYQIVNGILFGKGKNNTGILGENKGYYRDWVQISDFDNIIHIEACSATAIFLTDDGKVYGFGSPEGGVLKIHTDAYNDNGDFVTVPKLLFENCKYASLGVGFALFIKEDNTLWFLGASENGQSTTVTDAIYEPIQIAENIQYAKAFGCTSAWIDAENSLYLCGDNSHGQIGNGSPGHGFPQFYKDIVTTPYCALKYCKSLSVNDTNCVVQAETTYGSEYIWGGDYGPEPILINGPDSISVSNSAG